ncbi:DNA polymerase III subunit chi [BD1-7 clade bacterium]|uniref:DNA polymerase III subunit chi n=1 Tax=BD1-7 clade bacterium TaxID=2029982 RepID=A0A5S9QGR4_9GAMM|nr:DNA polymerase III subunit chi [BD1-7 clade bacterium]CAA0117821.1 DNA polymerase III subunit chi [BD1-7 clade bacterium]
MTKVDFYLVPETDLTGRYQFACKLVQKTFRLGHRIYIHCPDEPSARQLDEVLWRFQTQAFLPHQLMDGNTAGNAGDSDANDDICIGWQSPPQDHHDLLINLTDRIEPFFSRFQRVSEVLNSDEQVLALGRENFKAYRHKNYPLNWHDMRR